MAEPSETTELCAPPRRVPVRVCAALLCGGGGATVSWLVFGVLLGILWQFFPLGSKSLGNLLAVAVMCLVALAFVVSYLAEGVRRIALLRRGVPRTGEVVLCRAMAGDGATTYGVVVKITTEHGVALTNALTSSRKYQIGDTGLLLSDPQHPRRAELSDELLRLARCRVRDTGQLAAKPLTGLALLIPLLVIAGHLAYALSRLVR